MTELYINDILIDLKPGEKVVCTYAVNLIGDLSKINGSGTETFHVQMTNNNMRALGFANMVRSASSLPYRRNPAKIIVNGAIHLIGFALLISVKDDFEILLIGGNADWFSQISDKNLQELDLVALNHFFTATQVRSVRAANTSWSDGYQYPNCDYGEWTTLSTDPEWYQFRTGMWAKYVFWQIFREIGFTPAGDWYDNDPIFTTQEGLPFSAKFRRDTKYQHRWYTKFTSQATGITEVNFTGLVNNPVIVDGSHYNPYKILGVTDGRFVILDPIKVTMKLTGTTTNSNLATHNNLLLLYKADKNTTGPFVPAASYPFTVAPGTNPVEITFEVDGEGIYLFDVIATAPGTIQVLNAFTIEAISYEEYSVEDLESYLQIIHSPAIADTYDYVAVAGTLPDMKQIEFLRTIFNQYGLIFQTDSQTGFVTFFKFDDLVSNLLLAKDWSQKLDLSEKPEIRFVFSSYGRSNIMRYKADEADPYLRADPNYGSGNFAIHDETLPTEVVVFESEFAPIKRIQSFNGFIRMGFIPKYDGLGGDEIDCVPRIGLFMFTNINQITMNGYPLEPVQPEVHGLGLSFGVNLIPLYYGALTSILDGAKIVTAKFRLTAEDIANLDFSLPVYFEINGEGGYYYINEVQQYCMTERTITQVVLLQIA
jgi:hypothetical protein